MFFPRLTIILNYFMLFFHVIFECLLLILEMSLSMLLTNSPLKAFISVKQCRKIALVDFFEHLNSPYRRVWNTFRDIFLILILELE